VLETNDFAEDIGTCPFQISSPAGVLFIDAVYMTRLCWSEITMQLRSALVSSLAVPVKTAYF